MPIDLNLITALIGVTLSVATFFAGKGTALKREAAERAALNSKVSELSRRLEILEKTLTRKLDALDQNFTLLRLDHAPRLAVLEKAKGGGGGD